MRNARLALAVALVMSVSTAGCGGSGAGGTTGGGSAAEPEAHSSKSQPTAPAGASARGCPHAPAPAHFLRVTGTDCGTGRSVARGWLEEPSCPGPAAASRYSCQVQGWRCQGTAADRGETVGCSRPGRSIAFLVPRRPTTSS